MDIWLAVSTQEQTYKHTCIGMKTSVSDRSHFCSITINVTTTHRSRDADVNISINGDDSDINKCKSKITSIIHSNVLAIIDRSLSFMLLLQLTFVIMFLLSLLLLLFFDIFVTLADLLDLQNCYEDIEL